MAARQKRVGRRTDAGSHVGNGENRPRGSVEVPGGERPMMEFETITLAPIDLDLVDVSLLTKEERDWLNAYHARVRDIIGPELGPFDRAWLEAAAAPIG